MDINIPVPLGILDKEGKEKYSQIAEMLISDHKWKIGDELALSALCVNWQRWIQAEKAIKKNKDLCFITESGYRQQIPEISIAKDCMKTMLTYAKEFGLTPKERAKLFSAGNEDGDDDDEMEDLIQK